MTLIQRLLESEHLLLYVARTKVLHKQTFHQYALLLESSGQNHYEYYSHCYREQKRIGEACEIVADVEIESKVKAIIVDKLGVDEADVKPEASFTNDLGADSLDTVELIMEFEKEFGVNIPDDQAEKISTVGDAIAYIENAK